MSQIIRDITEISRCGVQYRIDQLTPMGLKACHASYLTEICANPGISQDQLAKKICINKSNVTRQAAVLEEEGLITRRCSPVDKRVTELYPTQKAMELLPQISGILNQWETRITAQLREEELRQLSDLLSRLKTLAVQYMEER